MCAHYHWTWDYLHWGIRWPLMQRILIDAPSYESPKGGKSGNEKERKLTPQTAEEILKNLDI